MRLLFSGAASAANSSTRTPNLWCGAASAANSVRGSVSADESGMQMGHPVFFRIFNWDFYLDLEYDRG